MSDLGCHLSADLPAVYHCKGFQHKMGIEKGPQGAKREEPREDVVDDDLPEDEFNVLNEQLDQLNGWLDNLEQKNANIHAQLEDLLQKSRKTREEFQKMLEKPNEEEMDTAEST